MRYVLDTNTLSDLMRGDAAVSERLTSHRRTDVYLPQPVIAEVEYGLARMPASKRRDRLKERFQVYLDELQRLPWTDAVSREFGRAKADLESRGARLEDFDVAVAAHALSIEATLVTDNVTHMERLPGLAVENWRS